MSFPGNKSDTENIYFSSLLMKKIAYGILLFTLFCSWFTYPLVFGMSHPKLFKGTMIILLGMSLVFILLSGVPARRVDFLLKPQWLLPIALYLIYLVCYILVSGTQLDANASALLLSSFVKLGFAWLLLLFLPWRINLFAFDLYARFIFILTLLAILQYFLMFKGLISPLGTIIVDYGGGVKSTLDNYGLALIQVRSSPVGGTVEFAFTRLQSFADEPGSFACGLLPALFWAFLQKRKLMVVVFILGLMLTMSVGAIIAASIVGLLYAWKRGMLNVLKVFSIVLLISALVPFVTPKPLLEVAINYLGSKYEVSAPSVTSGGKRIQNALTTYHMLMEQPWGYGAGQAHQYSRKKFGYSIAVGWFVVLIETGLVGGLAYFFAYTWLFFLALRFFFKENDKIILFVCASYISNYIMSAQRAQIDASFWLLWIITSMLMLGAYFNGLSSNVAVGSYPSKPAIKKD